MDDDRLEGAAAQAAPALGRAAEELRAVDAAARSMAASVGARLSIALTRAAQGSDSLGGALRGLAADMARSTLRSALRPVGEAVGGAVAQAAGGLAAGLTGAVRGFAKGGVIDRPTHLGAGVAGEAGPEAILPLARGADGRLGVRGGGVAVTVNIATPDAASFRRSESQIAATLARAVARGQRRL
jgi:phage-related minor tail protein